MNSKEKTMGDDALLKALKGFEKDESGKINVEEFKYVMMTLGDILKENEVIFFFVFFLMQLVNLLY